ncbi:MAG: DNA directed RNA polymerase subunit L [Harvfovirus sp.]|uniref:DNA directed RNA polymerase subunit L n=1 Tax=Harvfovirus sp. TaxID=2487768 RepID=A0A3G5A415_9VIRU|nr:MAG: DNA directed RNA polymerase subunit L [Harvfovirus sp.]
MNKKKIDISVKEIEYVPVNGFVSSLLTLDFSGGDMHYTIANTLRRVSYDDIPTYAFVYVNIEHNNSKAFDNDFMVDNLRQIPVPYVQNDLFYLHPKYWQNIDYYDKAREKHESEKLIEITVNAYNNTSELMVVTTKNMAYYIDGEPAEYTTPNKSEPIVLIELLPNQTFKCQLRACLGVGERDSIWFGSKLAYYEYEEATPRKVKFYIEATGQISEYEVLVKCCRLIKLKLNGIKSEIENRIQTKEIKPAQTIFLEFTNEDHTIGSLINNALQEHPHIVFAGVSKPDHLIKMIRFKMSSTNDVDSPLKPLFEVLEYLRKIYDHLENQFIKMGKIEEKVVSESSESSEGVDLTDIIKKPPKKNKKN